ncbi:MAG TPA: hypothetical protein VK663_06185, partial [Burkholderiales bacterium]|nr:hypothetical protein [Burkholderiales bacterium]
MSQEVKAPIATAMQLPGKTSGTEEAEKMTAPPLRIGGMALIKGMFAELSPAKIGQSVAREQDLDYMSETSAAALQGPPQLSHVVLWGVLLFIIAFLVWAAFANIGETTVGDGRVIPSGQIQVVQNLEGGIVSE